MALDWEQRSDAYQTYLASLEPCPYCGVVDEMDNIEGIVGASCGCERRELEDDDYEEDE